MQDTSARYWTFLVALLGAPVVVSAQSTAGDPEREESPSSAPITTAPQDAVEKPAQALRDDSELRSLHHLVISTDGAWMAAEERSGGGDGIVRVWSTDRERTFSIERGQNPRISRDSRWVSALQRPALQDSGMATSANRRAGQTLVLLDLQDGSRKTFDFVLSYDMTYASTYLLYVQSPAPKADEEGPAKDKVTKQPTTPAATQRPMGTLHQVPLDPVGFAREHPRFQHPAEVYTYENVVEFATHPTSHHFAYVWRDEEKGRDTLHICKWGIRAWYSGDRIEGLCWGRDPRHGAADDAPTDHITLGFLVSSERAGKDGQRRVSSALHMWKPGQSADENFTRVDDSR